MEKSLNIEDARRLLWESLAPGPTVQMPWRLALGKVTAHDLTSDLDFPPFARITMDGYAVRAADTAGARVEQPVQLRVVGTAAAGAPLAAPIGPGEAAMAMTGAPLPAGCDAVVRVEDTAGYDEHRAMIRASVAVGENIAQRGEDLRAGEIVVPAGTRLGPHHVQALCSAGWSRVPVIEPPSAAVLSTGDELVSPEAVPGPGQIRESNNPCVQAVLAAFGIDCVDLGVVGDDPGKLEATLSNALQRYEVVVISGGASKGTRDFVRPALARCGVQLLFGSLHLRPGHPAVLGRHPRGVVFGLPGNPVAVYATLVAVYAAGLRRLTGERSPTPAPTWARLAQPVTRRGARPWLAPVTLRAPSTPGTMEAVLLPHHGSGDFVSLARCEGLALLDGSHNEFGVGELVEVLRLPGASLC